jgi:DEAD/DEAH box helicase domain-containing protein
MLQAAGRDHVPVKPSARLLYSPFSELKGKAPASVPDPKDRPSIDAVIAEILEQEWYKEQIIDRRVFEAKEGQLGQ